MYRGNDASGGWLSKCTEAKLHLSTLYKKIDDHALTPFTFSKKQQVVEH
jgi:hypothetical protein